MTIKGIQHVESDIMTLKRKLILAHKNATPTIGGRGVKRKGGKEKEKR
jgi:hypothetical protein